MAFTTLPAEPLPPTPARSPAAWKSVVRVDPKTGHLVRVLEPSNAPARSSFPRPVPAALIFPAASPVPALTPRAATLDRTDVGSLVEATARRLDVDPLLVRSVLQTESAGNPAALSPKGAQGLMQLMPATARRFGVFNSFDPRENIEGGVKYLRYLRDLFQDDRLAIAAYNAGEGAVARYNGVPPYRETVSYVQKVAARYDAAKKASTPPTTAVKAALPPPEPAETHPALAVYYDTQGRLHMTTQ